MELKLWTNFGKKLNSTERPDETINIPFVLEVQFKEASSILNPVFLCNLKRTLPNLDPAKISYCYAPSFHRYYWVNDITVLPGAVWSISCRVDVLASYKDHIGALETYVLRSSNRYDDYIIDSNYPVTANRTIGQRLAERSLFVSNYEQGCYIVGVVTSGEAVKGGVQFYAFSYSAFGDFVNKLLSSIDWVGITTDEISTGLQKALFDPTQYITRCFWLPLTYNAILTGAGEAVTVIPYGWWNIAGISAFRISHLAFLRTGQTEFNGFLSHPQRTLYGLRYLDAAPYREISLTCPPFCRELQLPADILINFNQLVLSATVDVSTGETTLFIVPRGSDESVTYSAVMELRANVSVPIPLHVSRQDLIGGATHLLQGAKNTIQATGNLFMGNLGSSLENAGEAVSSIASAVESFTPDISSIGSPGQDTYIDIVQLPSMQYKFAMVADENRSLFGRPFCKTIPLATNPGFNKCARTPFPGSSATLEERREIENYLEGGFYFE